MALIPLNLQTHKTSLGSLAVLHAGVTCLVFEPADQHSLCGSGSAALHILGPARTHLLPGRKQTSF